MKKSKITLYFIFISFFTFLAIFLTIVQASYNNLVNPIKQVESDKYLEPLNPILDSEIISEIEKRQPPDATQPLLIDNLDINPIDSATSDSPQTTTTPIIGDDQTVFQTEENNE